VAEAPPAVVGPARAALEARPRPARIPGVVSGGLPFEAEAIARGVGVAVGGHRVRAARVEDLPAAKAIAHRPRDLGDIGNLLAANAAIDLTPCRRIASTFAAASAMPDLCTDVDRRVERAHRADAPPDA
jgi:hypothetical protein